MKQEYTIATGIRKYTGLMFRTRKTNPLVFNFDKPTDRTIHSWFVFFDFKAIWTLEDGTTEEQIVYSFDEGIKPSKPYIKLVEIPL